MVYELTEHHRLFELYFPSSVYYDKWIMNKTKSSMDIIIPHLLYSVKFYM